MTEDETQQVNTRFDVTLVREIEQSLREDENRSDFIRKACRMELDSREGNIEERAAELDRKLEHIEQEIETLERQKEEIRQQKEKLFEQAEEQQGREEELWQEIESHLEEGKTAVPFLNPVEELANLNNTDRNDMFDRVMEEFDEYPENQFNPVK